MKAAIEKEWKGVLLSTLLGAVAFLLSDFTPSFFNSVMLALFGGILLGNFFQLPNTFQSGISFTSGKLLELSILFLAFSINYQHIQALGIKSFLVVVVVLVAILLLTFYLAVKVKCPGSTGWLVGFGTAICGSSAIAALAPSVTKNKEDIGIAMAVVNLLGTLGMIAMPFLFLHSGINANDLGLLIGGSLHSVGNVAGAGYALDKETGDAALTIKLARVALLSPGLILFNLLVNKDKAGSWKSHLSLPWYLWGFILITLLTSVVSFPAAALSVLDKAGKLALTIAMAAIGLNVSFKKLLLSGKRGLGFGILIFAAQLLLLFALMKI